MAGSYQEFARLLLEQYIPDKTIVAMLMGTDFVPSYTQQHLSDIAAYEWAGGYDRETVTGVNIVAIAGSDEALVACDDVVFTITSAFAQAQGIAFYVDTGDPTTSPLIASDLPGAFDVPVGPLRYITDEFGGLVTIQVQQTESS